MISYESFPPSLFLLLFSRHTRNSFEVAGIVALHIATAGLGNRFYQIWRKMTNKND